MFSLKGKKAFVTGGSAGIGLGIAKAFVEFGATTIIADISDRSAVADGIGAKFVRVDVADETSVENALARASELLAGNLDIVVLNAGVGDVGPAIGETTQGLIEKITRINQWGVLYGLKHAPTHMNDGGSIITTSSMAAFIGVPGSAVYSASKRAVLSMTEMAALELGSRGIRVNAVCPGYTATAMAGGEGARLVCEAFTALGRVAQVDDLVGAFVFLAGNASAYVTGQSIKVDGGWQCGPTPRLLELVSGSSKAPG
jgi:NAD(P)-dependent dehydrogenase (short-subunit alcohol dehydrogenase family)